MSERGSRSLGRILASVLIVLVLAMALAIALVLFGAIPVSFAP